MGLLALLKNFFRPGSGKPTASQTAEPEGNSPGEKPELFYARGNRLFEKNALIQAADQWRQADTIWHPAPPQKRVLLPFLGKLRVALGVTTTVLVIHFSLYLLFPRDEFDLMLATSGDPNRSWWEQFMDSGRPQPDDNHKMTIREWWDSLRREFGGQRNEQLADAEGTRQGVPERWAELLRRYGRLGDAFVWELDYGIISGHGLSRLGDYDGAIQVLEQGLEHADNPGKLADLHQGLANAHYYKGYHIQPNGLAQYDLAQVSLAAKAYEKSLAYRQRPLSYGNLGWMYFLLGDFDRAEERSREALRLNGGLHYVRLNLGLIYLVQNRLRDSFDEYYRVISARPDDEVYLGGINDLKEILRDRPGKHPFAYLLVGVLAIKKGDLSQARDSLERFLSGPSQGGEWTGLARELLEEMDTKGLEQ